LGAYKDALMFRGYSEDSVQIAIVMCQKRHHTRLVYQQGGSEGEFSNPCVGLCVDGRTSLGRDPDSEWGSDDVGCINTPGLNEFYLNSHTPVLGTSKPCKYVLIYDEIGLTVKRQLITFHLCFAMWMITACFQLAEIELLTFWSTHLYNRCTRSVSYATPGKFFYFLFQFSTYP
jgi:hypothetical protein